MIFFVYEKKTLFFFTKTVEICTYCLFDTTVSIDLWTGYNLNIWQKSIFDRIFSTFIFVVQNIILS